MKEEFKVKLLEELSKKELNINEILKIIKEMLSKKVSVNAIYLNEVIKCVVDYNFYADKNKKEELRKKAMLYASRL